MAARVKIRHGAPESLEPHALETVMSLEVSEAHFNALSFVAPET